MSIREIKTENNQLEKDATLYFSDFWRGFVKFWWVGVLCGLLFGAAVFVTDVTRLEPKYRVSATFTVHTKNDTLTEEGSMSAFSFYYNQSTINLLDVVFPYAVESKTLTDRVCRDLGVAAMPAKVTVACAENINIITLTATGKDPQLTYDTLQSVMENYGCVTDYILGPTKLVLITAPQLPSEPVNTLESVSDPLKAVLAGLAVGAAWILLYAILRQTVRTKEDIDQELNQQCLGVLPQVTFKRYKENINTDILLSNPKVGSDFPESVRLLRGVVQNNLLEGDQVILVTSTAPGEGKSVTTVNLAAMFAQNNSRVLLIDGDLRHSGVCEMLFPKGYKAPADGQETLYDIVPVQHLKIDVLLFRSAQKQLRKIVQSNRLKRIVDELRSKYDLILIDTPPCGIISDAAIIASAADVAMYVIRQDTVMTNRVREGLSMLNSTDVRILGCVLNGALGGLGGYGHYYGYGGYNHYYRYGYSSSYGSPAKAKKSRFDRLAKGRK